MTNYRFILITVLFLPFGVFAQNEGDILRYSEFGHGGSAKFLAMSGAVGALGAEFSGLNYNPAGLGLFRKHQMSLTPTFTSTSANTDFLNNTNEELKLGFKFNNLGIALANKPESSTDWKFINVAVNYSVLNDFNSEAILQSGGNTTGQTLNGNQSLAETFVEEANGFNTIELEETRPFSADLAFLTYLIDPQENDSLSYVSRVQNEQIRLNRTINEKGRYGETAISVGANYLQKLFLGASIGIPSVKYKRKVNHEEKTLDENAELDEFTFQENVDVSGSGINLKLGAIFQATKFMRIGVAWQSGSSISLREEFDTEIRTRFNQSPDGNSLSFNAESPLGVFDYRVVTPGRIMLSSAFIIGNRASISIDYERINYQSGRIKPAWDAPESGGNFNEVNNIISEVLTSGDRLKLGGEYRFGPWAIRGGYQLISNPFNRIAVDHQEDSWGFSYGAGYKTDYWFVDIGISNLRTTRDYYPYSNSNFSEGALIKRKYSMLGITIGTSF